MPRGAKAKSELFQQLQEMAANADSVEALQDMLAKKAMEEGYIKPDLKNHPELLEGAQALTAWCAENNKRITIDGENGCKVRAVRKKKEDAEEE